MIAIKRLGAKIVDRHRQQRKCYGSLHSHAKEKPFGFGASGRRDFKRVIACRTADISGVPGPFGLPCFHALEFAWDQGTTRSPQSAGNKQTPYASHLTARIKTDQSFPILIRTLPRARLVAIRAYALTRSSISQTESIRMRTLPSSTSLAM